MQAAQLIFNSIENFNQILFAFYLSSNLHLLMKFT